jgi:hypothetical protein
MILVLGPDELLVRDVVGDIHRRGLKAEQLPPDAHAFSEVVARQASVVVGILPSHPRADEEEALSLVQNLIEASAAPPAPKVVLVTPAPPHALHVKVLKRSGAPYVVISTQALEEHVPPAYLPKRTTWVARELLRDQYTVATRSGLLDVVAHAVAEEAPVGVELAPERVQLDTALRAAGVHVRVVSAWLARLAAFCGQPALYCDAEGKLVARLGYEHIARALGALPGGQPA